jgi:hypothetical protein
MRPLRIGANLCRHGRYFWVGTSDRKPAAASRHHAGKFRTIPFARTSRQHWRQQSQDPALNEFGSKSVPIGLPKVDWPATQRLSPVV